MGQMSYEVPEKLRKIWAVEFDLLKVFSEVCEKNRIHFQVCAGTLLGMIRHRGFIPWDDDADVCMDRANFNKLLSLPPGEFPEPYFLQTGESDPAFFVSYARLRNSLTTAAITGSDDPRYNNGIYIDVHVLDGYTKSKWKLRVQCFLLFLVSAVISNVWSLRSANRWFVRYPLLMLRPLIKLTTRSFWVGLHTRILALYETSTDCVTMMTHGGMFMERYWLKRSELTDTVRLPFGDLLLPAPANYTEVLTRIYGDFMTPPPIEVRGKWHEGQIRFDPDVPYKEFFVRETTTCV